MTNPDGFNVVRLSRLVEGLMAFPESMYRARLLADRKDDDSGGGPVVLPWLGWDSAVMLLADIRNMVEAWCLAQAGDGKTKPNPVHSPSYVSPDDLPHGEVGLDDFMLAANLMGING